MKKDAIATMLQKQGGVYFVFFESSTLSFLLSQWKLGRQSGLKREEWLIGRKQSPVPSSWLELKYKKWSYVLMTALASGLEFAKALKREVTFIAIDPARCCDPELPSE